MASITNSSVFKEKPHIYNKLPSLQFSLRRKFESFIRLISAPFTFKRAGTEHLWAKMVAIKGRDAAPELTLNHFIKAHRDFLRKDSKTSASLLKALDQMEQDEKFIHSLHHSQPLIRKPLSEEKKQKLASKLINDRLKSLKNLKTGQPCIFTLAREGLHHPLQILMIEKISQDHFQIKWIASSEEGMKVKRFDEVPASLLESESFNHLLNEWVSSSGVSKTAFEELMQKTKIKESHARSLTYRVDKLFWTIISKKNSQDKYDKQTRLNADAFLLFKYFKNNQHRLTPTSKEYFILKQMCEGVSARILQAAQKKNLDEEDLNAYINELKIIEERLSLAKAAKHSIPSSRAPGKKFSFKMKSQLMRAQPIDRGEIKHSVEKAEIPLFFYNGSNIHFKKAFEIQTKEDLKGLLDAGRKLYEAKELIPEYRRFQLERFIRAVPFEKKLEQIWSELTFEEHVATQKLFYEISEELYGKVALENFAQHDLECFAKATFMIYNLANVFYGEIKERTITPINILYNIEYDLGNKERFFSHNFIYGYRQFSRDPDGGYAVVLPRTFWQKPLNRLFFPEQVLYLRSSQELERDKKTLEQELEYLKKQNRLITQLTGTGFSAFKLIDRTPFPEVTDILNPENQRRWMKPFQNPFLMALYQHGDSQLSEYSPEAFQAEPYEVLEQSHALLQYFLKSLRSKGVKTKILDKPSLEWSKEELQKILRCLGRELHELVAFMAESPELMLDQEIRNFIEALFFFHLHPTDLGAKDNMKYIDEVLLKSLHEMQLSFEEEKDPSLRYKKLETLLYYHEFHEKWKGFYPASAHSLVDSLNNLNEQIKKEEALQPLLGYAAYIRLRQLMKPGKELDSTTLSAIINTYNDIFKHEINAELVDPLFEREMQNYWIELMEILSQQEIDFSSVLDSICQGSHLETGRPWERLDQFTYQNDLYTVDLVSRKVSSRHGDKIHTRLPQQILSHPQIVRLGISQESLRSLQITQEGDRYQFNDQEGRPTLIQQQGKDLAVFRQYPFAEGKWLQNIDFQPDAEKLQSKGLFSQFKALINPSIAAKTAHHQFLLNQSQIYIDPENPKEGYAVNQEGRLLFKLQLQRKGAGFLVKAVQDRRIDPPTSFLGLTSGDKLNDHRFFALEALEKPENMMIWSDKGKIRSIELPRYNLSFSLVRGQLVCKTKGFEDYVVDPEAPLNVRQGLKHLLVLRPKDEQKPWKLIVPKALMLIEEPIALRPEVSGFGHLGKPFYYLGKLQDFTKGILEQEVMWDVTIDPKRPEIEFVSFDVRPFTEELVHKNYPSQVEVLELMEQALMLNDPVSALRFYRKLDLSRLNTKELQLISDFLSKPMGQETLPLKLKIGLDLHQKLLEKKRLTSALDESLTRLIPQLATEVSKMGIRVPDALRISAEDSETIFELSKGKLVFNPAKFPVPIEVNERSFKDTKALIELLVEPKPLLFSRERVDSLFLIQEKKLPALNVLTDQKLETFEKKALEEFQASLDSYGKDKEYRIKATKEELKAFVKEQVIPKTISLEQRLDEVEETILFSIHSSKHPIESIRMLSKHKEIASIDELRIALAQGQLESLQAAGRLPVELNLKELKKNLLNYFDLLSQRNALKAASKTLEEAISKFDVGETEWSEISKAVYQLLTLERKYDPESDPRLLIFEAQQFKNFKLLEGGLEQIDLINALLVGPKTLIAAPTGAGKTSVISVIQTLKKANGKNLAIQKVLPQLFDQTYEQLKSTMEDLLGLQVAQLRFDLRTPLTITEMDRGETKRTSYFKRLYHELETTIQNRGCLLTDYKSLPLLEEFFWKNADAIQSLMIQKEVAKENLNASFAGLELKQKLAQVEKDYAIDPLLLEHHEYLVKILLLVEEKGDINMDEPDDKCRPNQSIQIDLGAGGQPIEDWMKDILIEAYEELFNIPELRLSQNLQAEIATDVREKALSIFRNKMAEKFAKEDKDLKKQLLNYFSEMDETFLDLSLHLSLREKDKIAFIKTLCRKQFFEMITSKKEGSDYARSKDGRGVIVCHAQRPQPSRHGTLEEQLCYLAQDYFYKGITSHDLINGLKPLIKNKQEAKLNELLPGFTLKQVESMLKKPSQIEELMALINSNQESKKFFLRRALDEMKTSGRVISMNPQNILDMCKKNSGVSATLNSPESLPESLQVDAKVYGQVKASMAFRIMERAESETVTAYNPAQPEEMLKENTTCIIDGAGAFREPAIAAEQLLKKNGNLKKVVFNDLEGREQYLPSGAPSDSLKELGAVFPQAFTRGLDRVLDEGTKAVMTINAKSGIRAYFQIEGRLRKPTQQYQLAMPKDQLNSPSLQDVIREAVLTDARSDAKDIFNHLTQHIKGVARKAARDQLLRAKNMEDFFHLFEEEKVHSLFIGEAPSSYIKEGEYFEKHKHIIKNDVPPKKALESLIEAEKKKFPFAEKALSEIAFSEDLLSKMEPLVASIEDLSIQLGNELEIEKEQEMEEEQEQELELNVEQEQNIQHAGFSGKFPPRISTLLRHHLQIINDHYSPNLYFSDNFLPLLRNKNKHLVQRKPFDDAMYRVGMIGIRESLDLEMTILDPVLKESRKTPSLYNCYYDIRTKTFYGPPPNNMKEFYKLIAQVKIFDGRCNGWAKEELEGLQAWLWDCKRSKIQSRPTDEIKKHLVEEVLKKRPHEFPKSQLDRWFTEQRHLLP